MSDDLVADDAPLAYEKTAIVCLPMVAVGVNFGVDVWAANSERAVLDACAAGTSGYHALVAHCAQCNAMCAGRGVFALCYHVFSASVSATGDAAADGGAKARRILRRLAPGVVCEACVPPAECTLSVIFELALVYQRFTEFLDRLLHPALALVHHMRGVAAEAKFVQQQQQQQQDSATDEKKRPLLAIPRFYEDEALLLDECVVCGAPRNKQQQQQQQQQETADASGNPPLPSVDSLKLRSDSAKLVRGSPFRTCSTRCDNALVVVERSHRLGDDVDVMSPQDAAKLDEAERERRAREDHAAARAADSYAEQLRFLLQARPPYRLLRWLYPEFTEGKMDCMHCSKETLRRCERCRVTAFCSPECAQTAWDDGEGGGHRVCCHRWTKLVHTRVLYSLAPREHVDRYFRDL